MEPRHAEAELEKTTQKLLINSSASKAIAIGEKPLPDQNCQANGQSEISSNQRNECGRRLVWFRTLAFQAVPWSEYKTFVYSKYGKQYAAILYTYSMKYFDCLANPFKISTLPAGVKSNVLKAMVCLSKYLGVHSEYTKAFKDCGIKWTQGDSLGAFVRIFNNKHSDLGQWYKDALAVLNPNEGLYLRYTLLSGIRKEEGINSFNLITSLGSKLSQEYLNGETGFLEHFRYPKIFLRNTKNVYVSAVPKELLEEITHSNKVSYAMIRKRLNRNGLRLRIKELRSYYATNMRELGLLSEQIDLMQGRVGKGIFMQHYFKQNPKVLSERILMMLPDVEKTLL